MAIRVSRLIIDLTARTAAFERSMRRVENRLERMGKRFTKLGHKLTMGVSLPLIAIGGLAAVAAARFESSFAGVEKTVDATTEELAALRQGILDLSKVLPASAESIADVAMSAGQLGIETANILGFTRVMVDLGETTNLSSQEAATALARLANITRLPQDQFDRLGSTLVDLGNNLATTEAEILEMSLRLAGAGTVVGLTQAQILGMAGALSSLGVRAQAGGTAMSTAMIKIAEAVDMGGSKLQLFAKVAGISTTQFAKAFKEDAAGAIASFIEGLGRMIKSGQSVFPVLRALSLNEKRLRDALLRAASAGDIFRTSLDLGTKAFRENSALAIEVEKRYRTFISQILVMRNKVVAAAIALGQELLPALLQVGNMFTIFIEKTIRGIKSFKNMSTEAQRMSLAFVGILIIAGPLILAIGFIITAVSALISPFTLAAAAVVAAGLIILARWQAIKEGLVTIFNAIVQVIEDSLVVRGISAIKKFIEATNPLLVLVGEASKFMRASVSGPARALGQDIKTIADEMKADLDDLFSGIALSTDKAKEGFTGMADSMVNSLARMAEAKAQAQQDLAEQIVPFEAEESPAILKDIEEANALIERATMTEGQLTAIKRLALQRRLLMSGQFTKASQVAAAQQTLTEEAEQENRKKNLASTLSFISSLSTSENKKLAIIGKSAAIAQATMSAHVAWGVALESAPPPFNYVLAGAVLAAGLANVAKIAGISGFRHGGRPPVGTPSIVGEGGPELFIPDTAGRIIPSVALAGAGGGITVMNNNTFEITGMDLSSSEAAQSIMEGIADEVKHATSLSIELARRLQDSGNENEGRAF